MAIYATKQTILDGADWVLVNADNILVVSGLASFEAACEVANRETRVDLFPRQFSAWRADHAILGA